jgi:hypothetical protein
MVGPSGLAHVGGPGCHPVASLSVGIAGPVPKACPSYVGPSCGLPSVSIRLVRRGVRPGVVHQGEFPRVSSRVSPRGWSPRGVP